MYNTVYALLHIPTAEYVTIDYKIALCEDTVAANKLLSIMICDTTYYWGHPRTDFRIGKISLKEYEIPPDILEFDIISIPKSVLSSESLNHILTIGTYSWNKIIVNNIL